jgi:hypothetical protein
VSQTASLPLGIEAVREALTELFFAKNDPYFGKSADRPTG